MDEFTEVKRRVRHVKEEDDSYRTVLVSLKEKLEIVEKSEVYEELKKALASRMDAKTKIRCLALGSISQEPLLLYQFLFLILLAEHLGIKEISVWDPVFNETDIKIFTMKGCTVIETIEKTHENFYYMPHVPVEVLEEVVKLEKPQIMLTNNISVYSDKWTDAQLYDKFKNIALLRNVCDHDTMNKNSTMNDNGFEIATSKKKRKNRKLFVPITVEYDYSDCYFTKCKTVAFESSKDLSKSYGAAFSDMALYIIE